MNVFCKDTGPAVGRSYVHCKDHSLFADVKYPRNSNNKAFSFVSRCGHL